MQSPSAQFFHEHVLVKEPDTAKPKRTLWHQDAPCYCVDGRQTVIFWIPLDPMPRDVCPEFIAGSHRWGKLFYPRRFAPSWLGEDARFVERPGRTSPPYPGIGQKTGERLREDCFPVIMLAKAIRLACWASPGSMMRHGREG